MAWQDRTEAAGMRLFQCHRSTAGQAIRFAARGLEILLAGAVFRLSYLHQPATVWQPCRQMQHEPLAVAPDRRQGGLQRSAGVDHHQIAGTQKSR